MNEDTPMTTRTQPVPGADDIEIPGGILDEDALLDLCYRVVVSSGHPPKTPDLDAHLRRTWEWMRALNDRETYENRCVLEALGALTARASSENRAAHVAYVSAIVRAPVAPNPQTSGKGFELTIPSTLTPEEIEAAPPETEFQAVLDPTSHWPEPPDPSAAEEYRAKLRAADARWVTMHGATNVTTLEHTGQILLTGTRTTVQSLRQEYGDALSVCGYSEPTAYPRVVCKPLNDRVNAIQGRPGEGKTRVALGHLARFLRGGQPGIIVADGYAAVWARSVLRLCGVRESDFERICFYAPPREASLSEILAALDEGTKDYFSLGAVVLDRNVALTDLDLPRFTDWLRDRKAIGYTTVSLHRASRRVA